LSDFIGDFAVKIDDIDLKGIDAKSVTKANDSFSYVGKDAFGREAGELRYKLVNLAGTRNDTTIVQGDINGDGKADFEIILAGLKALKETDFIL
jgi:hypothetical protein